MAVNEFYSASLKTAMSAVGIQSFRRLAQQSGVSWRQIERLRRGEIQHLSIQNAMRLATTLNLSLVAFLSKFETSSADSSRLSSDETCLNGDRKLQDTKSIATYQQLEREREQQRSQFQQTFQSEALNILESLLLQWPTAVQVAQNNPTLPAVRLIPLLRPLEQLLQAWEIEAISTVGAIVPYDPTAHQWSGETAPPAVQHPVQVSHIGYRQRERLLYRAKVHLPKPDTV
jgi:molecular chaperone GrpE (heat shock protein)